jgi:exodeoxyribonuclease VII small subunit
MNSCQIIDATKARIMAKAKSKEFKFEKELERLEGLVQELEGGKLSLDDSLKKFEEGLGLYKQCKTLLNDAEKKVTILSESMKEEEYLSE